jgi:Outer membrane protein beta-barrel domain
MKSKNLFQPIIIVLLFVFSQQANAQYKSFTLGVKAAPNLGWLKTDQNGYKNQGVMPGFGWGLVAEFYFSENYAIGTGFNFNFQNGKLEYPGLNSGNSGQITRSYRLKYIEIPVLLKMKTNEIGDLRFFGVIGMGFSARLSSKAKDVFKAPSGLTANIDYRVIDSQTNLLKASMIVGAGIEYPFDKSTTFVAGINFNNGFSDALKGDNDITSAEHEGIPNFIELSLAIMF